MTKEIIFDKILKKFEGNLSFTWDDIHQESFYKDIDSDYFVIENHLNFLIGDGSIKEVVDSNGKTYLSLSRKGWFKMTNNITDGYNNTRKKEIRERSLKIFLAILSAATFILVSYRFYNDLVKSTATPKTKSNSTTNLVSNSSDTFHIQCDIPAIENIIANCDTIFNTKNYKGHVIKCFDKVGHLLKIDSTNLFESNMNKVYAYSKIYDTANRLTYESISKGLVKFHCYTYKHDANGHLIEKSGYSSGELGIKVSYVYEGDKLIKEITERPGEKTEKSY